MSGRVSLVGAGPGEPGWITWRGLELLRAADVVVHDRLASAELLREAKAGAKLIDAGKAPGRATLEQEEIHQLVIAEAQAGRAVVRLKGGDPFVFGRGFEELAACRAAGVYCEVVPGVSSAVGGPAAAGIPVTLRGVARGFAVVTAHAPGDDGYDWAALAKLDTLVVLMGRARLQDVSAKLIAAGRAPSTPAAVIEAASTPDQRVTRVALSGLGLVRPAQASPPARLAPAVVVIGEVARLARSRGDGPLAGRRVLITRPQSAAGPLRELLRQRGADVLTSPLIRTTYRKPRGFARLFDGAPGWVVFASRHAVVGLWRALRGAGLDARAFAGARLAAIGPSTARALEGLGLAADVVAEPHRAAALVEALAPHVDGVPVLFPCGSRARGEIADGLRRAGAAVRELIVYATLPQRVEPEVRARLERGLDAVLFHSPSAVRAWVAERLAPLRTVIACLGTETAEAALRAGLEPGVIANEHADEGLVAALEEHFRNQAHRLAVGA